MTSLCQVRELSTTHPFTGASRSHRKSFRMGLAVVQSRLLAETSPLRQTRYSYVCVAVMPVPSHSVAPAPA